MSLREGFARSGLSFEQAWIEYLTMGGQCSRTQVMDVLTADGTLEGHEHNRLATALNEFYVDDMQ